jgi:hypothetical protein
VCTTLEKYKIWKYKIMKKKLSMASASDQNWVREEEVIKKEMEKKI